MKETIADLIQEFDLARVASQIEASVQSSLLLNTAKSDEAILAIGKSKLGGLPDLSRQSRWPTWHGKPLSFIAQINLADLPKVEFLNVLPASGVLSFFYSAEQETWGYDPKDKGSWQVIYNENRDLVRTEFPRDLPTVGKYACCSFDFEPRVAIAPVESAYVQKMGLSDAECRRYGKFEDKFNQELYATGCVHRLLGHPDVIQGNMQLECQLVSNGLDCGNPNGYENPKAVALKPGAINWQLLLQIDSDDRANMMWGDAGRIYYWIKQDDLKNKRFDTSWMILQCT